MSYLEITEEWIKDRVSITNERLDDIKSLSLPGTYEEKIYKVGKSLIHFTRLKELDLSRNCIESIEGLDHLICLETLNLYYNNIASMKELYRLKNNQRLVTLDFRLNPVGRNEKDYRLCLIQMLPYLGKLDDRVVKLEERKAALMYFGSDQSNEFSKSTKNFSDEKTGDYYKGVQQPRVDMVNRWTRGVIKDETLKESNLHNNTGDNISPQFYSINQRGLEEYTSVIGHSNKKRLEMEKAASKNDQYDSSPRLKHSASRMNHNYYRTIEKNTETKIPGAGEGDTTAPKLFSQKLRTHSTAAVTFSSTSSGNLSENVQMLSPRISDKLCDLIDEYWNGHKSLHKNFNFLKKLSILLVETVTNSDIDNLNKRVQKLEKENAQLQLISKERLSHSSDIRQDVNADLRYTNELLRDQIFDLRKRLEASEKMSEVTDLLKQSHESLIVTNEELRRELMMCKSLKIGIN